MLNGQHGPLLPVLVNLPNLPSHFSRDFCFMSCIREYRYEMYEKCENCQLPTFVSDSCWLHAGGHKWSDHVEL